MLVTATIDIGADRVIAKLRNRNASVFRLNTDHLPVEAHLEMRDIGAWNASDGPYQVQTEDAHAVWFRKIRYRACPPNVDSKIHAYVCREANAMLRAFLETLPSDTKWMSPVRYVERAELKPVQLEYAHRAGIRVPKTYIGSRPGELRAFARSTGRVIAKPIRSGYVPTSDGDFGIFTQRVDDDMLAQLDESLPCPIILQEEIGKKYDIRVTVVGNRVFSSAIDSQVDPAARVDWRRTVDPDLPHYRHALPFELTQRCLVLMSQLGLVYGALDFVLGNDGQYTFLEVNPNGEWLWLEDKLDYPISDAIADWLVTSGPQL